MPVRGKGHDRPYPVEGNLAPAMHSDQLDTPERREVEGNVDGGLAGRGAVHTNQYRTAGRRRVVEGAATHHDDRAVAVPSDGHGEGPGPQVREPDEGTPAAH